MKSLPKLLIHVGGEVDFLIGIKMSKRCPKDVQLCLKNRKNQKYKTKNKMCRGDQPSLSDLISLNMGKLNFMKKRRGRKDDMMAQIFQRS